MGFNAVPPVLDHLPLCCMRNKPSDLRATGTRDQHGYANEWVSQTLCVHLNGDSVHILFQHVLSPQVGL